MRQSKYLNDLIEQDHRAIERVVRPLLGFKSFRCARAIVTGIETMHLIKKGQLEFVKDETSSAADKSDSSASSGGPIRDHFHPLSAVATSPPARSFRAT